jgi:MFS superfamily sulfate permease-like transporter
MNKPSFPMTPKTGLEGLKENWSYDLLSGFMVFLVALPLSLGISVASGFPPSAGIITAIIGGLLVSRINGSFLTINGPAAGLIVVILASVQTLGEGDAMAGYRYTLAAIVVASIIQVALGLSKMGQLSSFFPTSVAHGMLAAIGIIIIITQTHVMLGVHIESRSVFSNISQIPQSLINMKPDIILISFLSLLILIIWPLIKSRVPSAVIVILIGILFAEHFDLSQSSSISQVNYLVVVPDNFLANFYFPDFTKITRLTFWGSVLSISLIGSLETILVTSSVDKLDPYRRHSNMDRDLTAIGIGNIVAGLLGGLPMIAEIIRSSTNINNGARTAWSNFFHGLILLFFVVFLSSFIQKIPLACLAALLVYTGYYLTSRNTFARINEIGKDQLLSFVATIIGILTTDLLTGVALGICVELVINLTRGVWPSNLFRIHFTITQQPNKTFVVKLLGSALFSNILPLKKALNKLSPGHKIIFDLTDGYLVDHSVMEFLANYKKQLEEQGGQYLQVGSAIETFSDHALAARLMTADERK